MKLATTLAPGTATGAVNAALGRSEPPAVNLIKRAIVRCYYRLQRPLLLRRVRRYVIEEVDGRPHVVAPSVLNPLIFRGGEFLARTLSEAAVAAPRVPDSAWALDMGTGSGVGAIAAAARGYRVVAVDLNPGAVRCARANVVLNEMEARVEVLAGDLFAPVAGRRFELIVFNPPFFRGQPRDDFDLAFRGVDVMERFASELREMLAPEGRALILLSTDGDAHGMLRSLDQAGFALDVVARRDLGNEIMTIYQAEPRPAAREAQT